MSTKTIHQIFNSAFDSAVTLQNRRDAVDAQNYEDIKLSDKEQKHLECLEKIIDICEIDPYFFRPPTDEFLNIDFSFVTGDWIKEKLAELNISQKDFAHGVNTTPQYLSSWLSGVRNPSGPAQAAIYYYISNAHAYNT